MIVIGVIADTHGLLRPEALRALEGADQVIHAGDIGNPKVLELLRARFPVTAVRGNVDRGVWAEALPGSEVVQVGEVAIYVLHNLDDLDLNPAAARFAAVISGHSHRPSTERQKGVLYLNPGSAGPRRFSLPVTLARLTIRGREVEAQLFDLEAGTCTI